MQVTVEAATPAGYKASVTSLPTRPAGAARALASREHSITPRLIEKREGRECFSIDYETYTLMPEACDSRPVPETRDPFAPRISVDVRKACILSRGVKEASSCSTTR